MQEILLESYEKGNNSYFFKQLKDQQDYAYSGPLQNVVVSERQSRKFELSKVRRLGS